MSVTLSIDLPEDLAAQAAQLEGLPQRLASWLRAEVSLDTQKRSPHHAVAKEIVQHAMERAARSPMTETEKEAARATFVDRYETMIAGLKDHA